MIPTNPHAHCDAENVPHFEPVIARAEIELFLITWPIGDVALAIGAKDVAIRPDHGDRVVIVMPVALEKAGRDRDLQLRRQLAHRDHRGVLRYRTGKREIRLILLAAKVRAGEKLGRQNNLCPARSGLLNQIGNRGDIGRFVSRAKRQLQGGKCDQCHTLPPRLVFSQPF